ncbi:MAG: hypothetical protein Q7S86_03575 [bacterium]|nr:hypothetical protein [bacterium]
MSRLTLSIHKVRTDADGNPTLLRALLWNGYLTWHVDSILWVATWDHPNFFQNLAGLRKEVARELEHRGDVWKNILGIHTGDACWPLDPSLALSQEIFKLDDVQRVEVAAMHPITHCGGYKGLSCLVAPDDGDGANGARALLYDMLPLPPAEQVVKALVSCACFGTNLFRVAAQLRESVIGIAMSQKLSNVRGLYSGGERLNNREACWPEGLGVIRYQ